jgi:hypothetical protein
LADENGELEGLLHNVSYLERSKRRNYAGIRGIKLVAPILMWGSAEITVERNLTT